MGKNTVVFSVLLFSLLVLFQTAQSAEPLYGPKSNVIHLSKKSFADVVFGSEHVWVVEFYAPWCGHCKQLAPEYEKAAGNLKGIVKVGGVDCDKNREFCGSFGVKGFPTIKVFPSQVTPVPGKEGAFHKVPEDYNGPRTAAAIVNFALSKLPSFVVPVNSSTIDKFLEEKLPKAILFTNKGKTSDLYKALSIDFHHRFILGEAKHTDKKLVEKYGVTEFPTLLVLRKEPVKFEGKLSHEALSKFLEPYAEPAPKKEHPSSKPPPKEKEPSEPEAEPATGEIYLAKDQATFDEQCVNKGNLCAVAFLDYSNFEQEELDRYINVLKALGEKFKGKVRVVYLDGPSQPALTKALDLSANYPNAVVLSAKKKRYTPFLGAFSEESLSDFFEAVLRGKRSFVMDVLPPINPFTPPPPKPPQSQSEDKEEL